MMCMGHDDHRAVHGALLPFVNRFTRIAKLLCVWGDPGHNGACTASVECLLKAGNAPRLIVCLGRAASGPSHRKEIV